MATSEYLVYGIYTLESVIYLCEASDLLLALSLLSPPSLPPPP